MGIGAEVGKQATLPAGQPHTQPGNHISKVVMFASRRVVDCGDDVSRADRVAGGPGRVFVGRAADRTRLDSAAAEEAEPDRSSARGR